ncbi:MAG: G8 domain-containing protein, partial [Chloroflexi bacterium]|nr:G8 domain-containing protein [Chloroflexota bacterium]
MPSIPGTPTSLAQAATFTNVTNGNWSSSATWGGGSIPQTGDAVVIAPGTTVVYDVVSDEIIAGVTVFGTLQFSRSLNSRLKLSDNFFVENGGYLNMGNAADPIPATTKIEVVFVIPLGLLYVGGAA